MSDSRSASPGSPLIPTLASTEPQTLPGAVNAPAVRQSVEAARSGNGASGTINAYTMPEQHEAEKLIAIPSGYQVQQVAIVTSGNQDATDAAVAITTAPVPITTQSASTVPPVQPPPAAPSGNAHSKPKSVLKIMSSWIPEMIACTVAILMIASIIIVLAYFNHRLTTRWHVFSWKINSVIAFFTALLEAAVAYVIGSCLGQLRWLWYHEGARKLKWMDRLTDARTAPGALAYFMTKGPWQDMAGVGAWAGLGALLVLLLVGVGVFTQNVITQDSQFDTLDFDKNLNKTINEWGSLPQVPVANYYWYQYQYGDDVGHEQPEVSMMSAINAGFLYSADLSSSDTLYEYVGCGTGNCTFRNYSTLAVCSQCADISDQIVIPCNSTHCLADQQIVYLPDHFLTMNSTSGFLNMTSDTAYPNSTVLPGVGPLIAHVTALANAGNFPFTQPYATECALYWCVQTTNATYNISSVSNMSSLYNYADPSNVFAEGSPPRMFTDTSASATNYTPSLDGDVTILLPECYINGSQVSRQNTSDYPDNCTFSAGGTTHRALQNYLVGYPGSPGFLQGVVVSTNTTGPTDDPDHWNISSLAAQVINAGNFASCQPNNTDSSCGKAATDLSSLIDGTLGNMALYMTNEMRKGSSNYTYGTMQDFRAHYKVEWGWLAYPIAVVLIALVFLVATMVRSKDTDPWKASVLALILHGLDDEARNHWHELDDPREMRNVRQTWLVTLDRRDGTYAFRRESVSPTKTHAEITEKGRTGTSVTAGELVNDAVQAYGSS